MVENQVKGKMRKIQQVRTSMTTDKTRGLKLGGSQSHDLTIWSYISNVGLGLISC